jgi:hypothetical protein
MSCDCISKVEKIIKEKTNESGCLDASIGVPSGVLKVNIYGMFHKQKKDGTFREKWETLNILPEYCPFCGKKYVDDKKEEVQHKENEG